MRPICLLAAALVLMGAPAAAPGRQASPVAPPAVAEAPFEAQIREFEAADARSMPAPGGVVFVGSSSIRLWRTLAADYPGQNVINRGFGGSQLGHSVLHARRIVTKYQPRLVVLFAGTNDLQAGKSAADVAAEFDRFVAVVRAELPDVRIAFLSITPAPSRWDKLPAVIEANRRVRERCRSDRGLIFLDAFDDFVTPDGQPRPELFVADRLHLSDAGYQIWRDLVAPILPWPATP